MAVQQASFYCPTCQQQRLFTSQGGVNHVFYLLLTLFSCGLWAIVWFIQNVSYVPRFHCSQCGYSDAVKYLANPYLRSQEAQQRAVQESLRGELSGSWFSRLTTQTKIFIFVGVLLFIVIDVAVFSAIDNAKRKSNTQTDVNSTANNSSANTTASATPYTVRFPPDLSPAENLEKGKDALSRGDEKTAWSHLVEIKKGAKEFSSAKLLLASIDERKQIEFELAELDERSANINRLRSSLVGSGVEPENWAKQLDVWEKSLRKIGARRIELNRKLETIK